MQISELYRRGVVRPLDDDASRQQATVKFEDSLRTEWLPILSDSQFAEIWKTGILQQINEACNVSISDYEDVELHSSHVEMAMQVMKKNWAKAGSARPFFQMLLALLAAAKENKSNVYFVF